LAQAWLRFPTPKWRGRSPARQNGSPTAYAVGRGDLGFAGAGGIYAMSLARMLLNGSLRLAHLGSIRRAPIRNAPYSTPTPNSNAKTDTCFRRCRGALNQSKEWLRRIQPKPYSAVTPTKRSERIFPTIHKKRPNAKALSHIRNTNCGFGTGASDPSNAPFAR